MTSTPKEKRGRVTAQQIADEMAISVSTVSRAFTKGAVISEKTRELIFKKAKELSYRPNSAARSLVTQRSNIVGVVVPDITNPFYPEALKKLAHRLQKEGLHVMLFALDSDHDTDNALSVLLQYQPDILIIMAATLSYEMARQCREIGTPMLLFNRYTSDSSVASVCCDNERAAAQAADYLIDTGHVRPAFIAGRKDTSTNKDRQKGFVDRLKQRGINRPIVEEAGEYTYEAGYEAAKRLLQRKVRPDAIVGANDLIALAAIDVARWEFGLSVPEDISVMGFDDIKQAAWPSYGLTTMRQPLEKMIEVAATCTLEMIAGGDTPKANHLVPGELVIRTSTKRGDK